jgi:hypothetical protein
VTRLLWHSDVKTTTGYYANGEAAVEEAVLGAHRHSPCNNRPADEGE